MQSQCEASLLTVHPVSSLSSSLQLSFMFDFVSSFYLVLLVACFLISFHIIFPPSCLGSLCSYEGVFDSRLESSQICKSHIKLKACWPNKAK